MIEGRVALSSSQHARLEALLQAERDGFCTLSYEFDEDSRVPVTSPNRFRVRVTATPCAGKNLPPLFALRRDGKLVFTGTHLACVSYIHQIHSFSFDHALIYEGYSIEEVKP